MKTLQAPKPNGGDETQPWARWEGASLPGPLC